MDKILGALYSLLIILVGAIYNLVATMFELFSMLSKVTAIDKNVYVNIIENFYLLIGVVMLFIIAFYLLKAMINPDDNKETSTGGKIVKNFITSVIILLILPTIFNFAFSFQFAIVDYNTIGKIFGYSNSADTMASAGNSMANSVFTAFFTPSRQYCANKGLEDDFDECAKTITSGKDDLSTVISDVNKTGYFTLYSKFGYNVAKNDIDFNFLIALFGGIYLLYVIFSFCLDLGVRLVKLVFYQIIAPIPVFLRVVPEGKLSNTFNDWVKITITCYLEVFIRLFIIFFGVYLISAFTSNEGLGSFLSGNEGSGFLGLIAKVIIIIGVLTFMKQAPKLIGEAFGFDSSNIKLGLSEKLGGLFAAGGAVGSLIASKGNPLAAIRGWKNGIGNIGAEAKRRKEYKDARSAGVTKRQMMMDYMLSKAGFESSYDRENSELEDKKFKVTNSSDSPITYKDINGEEHTINSEGESELDKNDVENLNARKRKLSSNIAEIREKISMRNDQNSQNDDIISGRKAFKDEYEKKVREGEFEGTYYYWKKVGSNWEKREYKGDINSIENFYKNFLTAEEQEYSNVNRFEVVDSETGESKWVGGETMKKVFDRFGEEYAKSGKNQKVTAGINEALEAAASKGAKTEFFDYEYNENGIRTGEILKTTMKVTKQDGKYVAKVVVTKSDGTIIDETEPIDDALEIISKRDKLAKADSTYLNSLNAQDSRLIAPQEDEMKAIDSIVAQYNDAIESYKDREEFKRKEISSKYIANRNNNNK